MHVIRITKPRRLQIPIFESDAFQNVTPPPVFRYSILYMDI